MPNKEKITKRKEKTSKIEPQIRERFFNAIKNNDFEKVKNIVESEVLIIDANCINNALIVVLKKENWEMVKYLIDKGADANTEYEYNYNKSKTALIIASEKENLEMVKYLVEHGADVNAKNKSGKTALIMASEKGNLEIVKYLVEHSASDINFALLNAAINENLEMVKYLVESGADVDV